MILIHKLYRNKFFKIYINHIIILVLNIKYCLTTILNQNDYKLILISK